MITRHCKTVLLLLLYFFLEVELAQAETDSNHLFITASYTEKEPVSDNCNVFTFNTNRAGNEGGYRWEKVSFDTLTLSSNESDNAFRNIFVTLDSLIRVSKIKAYYSYLLNNQYTSSEVKHLGWNVEVFQRHIDRRNPICGTIDSIAYIPFTAKNIQNIVVTYENQEVLGISIPRAFSLSILIEEAPGVKKNLYCLDYEEIDRMLSAEQMLIVDNYLMESNTIK